MMAGSQIRQHLCPLCEASCGLNIHLDDGEVTLIRGNRDDPFSRGFLCPKGTALRDLQADPDRLRRPIVKRNGRFVEVDIDEAFDTIHRRLLPILDEHGPSAAGLVIGNPTVHRTGLVLYVLQLAAALGTPNVFSAASLDQMPKQLAVGRLYGDFYSLPVPDIDRTDMLVVIGANPMVSNGSMWSVPDFRGRARALRDRGGQMVVIDPRRTETADAADLHLPIRPGTDAFFLAALINEINSAHGVQLAAATGLVSDHALRTVLNAVAPFTADAVAPACGVSSHAIATLAHDLAAAPTAAVYGRIGTCHQLHATLTSWLIEVVNIITGNLDRPGGAMFACPPAFATNTSPLDGPAVGVTTGAYHSRVSGAPEVMNQFPLACLAEEIDTPGPDQIRTLVTTAANPVLSGLEGARLAEALSGLDFMVSLDIYINETTRHADVIMPGPSPLEEDHYDVFFSQFGHRNAARYTPAVLPRSGDLLDDWETMARLVGVLRGQGPDPDVRRLDDELMRETLVSQGLDGETIDEMLARLAPRVGAERMLDLAIRTGPYGDMFGAVPDGLTLAALEDNPHGIDLGELTPRLPGVLRTSTGEIEIAPPDFVEALVGAAHEIEADNADCVLIGRRHLRSNNSWMHNLPILAKGRERCTLLVHPADAARWGLVDGAAARVTSHETQASLDATVEIDDAMMPGVVSLPHGWGHVDPHTRLAVASARPGVNVNELFSHRRRDPLSGNAALCGVAVTVAPVDTQPQLDVPARS